jgi:hypothetical protein
VGEEVMVSSAMDVSVAAGSSVVVSSVSPQAARLKARIAAADRVGSVRRFMEIPLGGDRVFCFPPWALKKLRSVGKISTDRADDLARAAGAHQTGSSLPVGPTRPA